MGKVVSVTPTATGATAELSLKSSPKIPADVQANVRSVSAVGEQYVDLIPQRRRSPVPRRGLGDRAGRHHDPAEGRTSPRSTQRPRQERAEGEAVGPARRVVPRLQRSRLRRGFTYRLRIAHRRRLQRHCRAHSDADRRQRSTARLAGGKCRHTAHLGAQPGRSHRSDRRQRSRDPHHPRHRPRHRGRDVTTARPDQADAARAAREPDLGR